MTSQSVSVLIPVHHTETASYLREALNSITNQSYNPSEIVIVKDETNEAPEIDEVIDDDGRETRVYRVQKDHTLGYALQQGLEMCNSPLVARMDSDDLSEPNRLKKQVDYLESNPNIDAIGSYLAEFVDRENGITGIREVPTNPNEIRSKARFRSPMNHPTVTFRKQSVLDVGGYRDTSTIEDYDLWARMLMNGAKLANIPEVLVKARAGPALYQRRGGVSYARTEYELQKDFLARGFVSFPIFLFNLATRLPVRLLPNQVREQLYRKFLRR